MADKIGTLGDRIANRIIRYFPGPKISLKTDVPIVSFTMDDAPVDAWRHAAQILEDEGGRGTFYISGRLSTERPEAFVSKEQCYDLYQRGHELGSHTYAHRKLRAFSRGALKLDLSQNEAFLTSVIGKSERRNFAFPYGMASPLHRGVLRENFRTSRSIHPGVNRGPVDPCNLLSVELRPDPAFLAIANQALEDVLQNPGWLIFFTHDVSPDPSFYGCASDVFRDLIRRASARGAKVMTVDQAADHFQLPK